MTPVFAAAEKIIAPAVQTIGDTLVKALAQPAVQQSITAVAKGFTDLLNAMSPNIVSGIGAIANSITNMANAVANNPRPFADFIKFLFGVVNAAIQTVAWLTRVADWIESFHTFWAAIGKGFDEVLGNIKTVWNWLAHFHDFWKLVWSTALSYVDGFVAGLKIDFKAIGTALHVASDVIHGNWGNIWTDIKNGAKSVVPVVAGAAKQIASHFTNSSNSTKEVTKHLKHTVDAAKEVTKHTKHASDAAKTYRHSISTQPIVGPVKIHPQTTNAFASIRHETAHLADNIATPFKDMWNVAAHTTEAGIKDVGKIIHFGLASFNNWWKQHGTEVKEAWHALWTAIKQVVGPIIHGIGVSIKVGLDVIKFAFRAIALVVKVQWTLMWNGVKGVTKAAVDILKGTIHAALKFIEIMWSLGWNLIKDIVKIGWDVIVGIINVALDIFTGHWSQAWNDIKTTVTQVWNSFKDIFKTAWKTLTDAVGVAFGLLKTVFVTGGGDIIKGLFNGITGALKDIGSWISTNIYHPIVDHIKSLFGIKSPASTMKPIGKELITGIFHGMISEGKNIEQFAAKIFGGWPKAILSFVTKGMVGGMTAKLASFLGGALGWATKGIKNIGGFFGSIFSAASGSHGGAGVARWAGTVGKALTMLNLPQSLAGDVLYQMQTESSGNPNVINTWDSNARAGHPSQGLMQVIPSTFGQYHVAGTSWNILDPLANIAAALNYAKHNKGFGSGPGQVGSGHGYDTGGWLPTGVTMAMNNTGRPERILSPNELKAFNAGQGPTYVAHFDGLTSQAISAEVRTAFHMMSLTQGQLGRPGRRN
jgi:phage-related protein